MTLNPFLHPRNPYKTRPDFKELARKDLEFRGVAKIELSGRVSVDFGDRDTVRVLTESLLRQDFGLTVRIPQGALVPTLPLRFNYLLWIEDLLLANGLAGSNVVGLDVGTGSTCVYPLLAAKHLGWCMFATEKNEESLVRARENVEANGMNDRVKLLPAGPDSFFGAAVNAEKVDFTMCNPPFYGEDHSAEHGGEKDRDASAPLPPAGRDHEMCIEGGEVALVRAMLEESSLLCDKVAVFTCMIGHKSNVKLLKKHLLEMGDKRPTPRFVFTEFCQGRTMRWGVAWTFRPQFLLPDVSLLKQRHQEKKKHAPMTFTLDLPPGDDCKRLYSYVVEWMKAIDVIVKASKVSEDRCSFTIKTFHQNWKNQRRKRREKMRLIVGSDVNAADVTQPALEPPMPKKTKVVSDDSDEMEVDQQHEDQEQRKQGEIQLCCRVFCEKADGDKMNLEVQMIDGVAGKDEVHQVIQYIKNRAARCTGK